MHAPQSQGSRPGGGDELGLGSARQVLLPTPGCLGMCAVSPLTQAVGCGQGAGSRGPCLQHLFQPCLTRVRARPCYPPLQDARPHNCLQLQTARSSAPASDRNQRPSHFHRGPGRAAGPYCRVWGSLWPLGTSKCPGPWGSPRMLPLGCRESVPIERLPSLSLIRMKLL